jgi:tripartite ATP-independent transporter DctM subunit
MVMVGVISVKRKYSSEMIEEVTFLQSLKEAILPMLLPLVIIGGIRLGIFTATEAGAVAIIYAVVLAIVYREFRWANMWQAMKETVLATAGIMLIVGAASAFAWILTRERLPQRLTEFILANVSNKYVFLLIVGMFIEGNASMIVLVPLFVPVARAYGIDDIQFAMMFIFNMAIGALSPPMGTLMFVTCGITKCKIAAFIKEAVPFYILILACLVLLTFFPFFTLTLVNLVY